MEFASDNTAGAAPEVWAALAQANAGSAASYGEDVWTARAQALTDQLFARPTLIFPVASGMAANCLAVSTFTPRYGAVFVHEEAHLLANESTAPEFFTSARFVPVAGAHGKIDPQALRDALARHQRGNVHAAQPAVLSLTQATETGTVYSIAEIEALSAIAHEAGMRVHMDGARFANAVAALDVTAAEATWKAGVDVLSFGLTKNGALNAEMVVFFSPDMAGDFAFLRKRAAHLLSKMRFLSAQIVAMLEDGLWLTLARSANASAARLAAGLARIPGVVLDLPSPTNSLFPILPRALVDHLQARAAHFYPWGPELPGNKQRIRLVTSFATTEQDVEKFLTHAAAFQDR